MLYYVRNKYLEQKMSTNEDIAARKAQEIKEQRRADRNLRRRTRYALMSPERKQSFLSQLRAKRAELKKQRLSYHSTNTLSSTEVATQTQRQPGLIIVDSLLTSEEGNASRTTNVPNTVDKENNMISCLSVVEVGSASGSGPSCINATNLPTPAATANRPNTVDKENNMISCVSVFEVVVAILGSTSGSDPSSINATNLPTPTATANRDLLQDAKQHPSNSYFPLKDVEDNQLGIFDRPLPCFGCRIGWFSPLSKVLPAGSLAVCHQVAAGRQSDIEMSAMLKEQLIRSSL
ncbi:uncharacterized protein LOC132604142 isoform X2 [Lycium barbarum]|uniref:uncharacterized protein LOC132604142 isoform X2 n=1 Tax=Lycium barbarum TaxID=112863 RepID=UPI00293F2A43|nr:uncharacterized protein LOC132604142 isoform X2 [Lycium barbarum]